MNYIIFASESSQGISALGVNMQAFIIQLITFGLVLALLVKFAFKPIVKILEKRRVTVEDGVKLGLEAEAQRIRLKEQTDEILRNTHQEADKIISNSHHEAREISRDARAAAHNRSDQILRDAQIEIIEETQQARLKLGKEISALVSEATEVIIHEKIDSKKDNELIKKTVEGHQ